MPTEVAEAMARPEWLPAQLRGQRRRERPKGDELLRPAARKAARLDAAGAALAARVGAALAVGALEDKTGGSPRVGELIPS